MGKSYEKSNEKNEIMEREINYKIGSLTILMQEIGEELKDRLKGDEYRLFKRYVSLTQKKIRLLMENT